MYSPLKRSNNFIGFDIIFLLIILLQACSSNELGKTLSESFDNPVENIVIGNNSSQNKLKKNAVFTKGKNLKEQVILNSEAEKKLNKPREIKIQNSSPKISKKVKAKEKDRVFNPQPYRIIIKLSGANPSAPAETLTEALRKAGIKFEVERIERFNIQSNSYGSPSKRSLV